MLEEARDRSFNKEKELEIYQELCDVGGWHIGQLEQACKAWDVRASEAIEDAKSNWGDDWNKHVTATDIVDDATERCGRIAFYEEFEKFDWDELSIDANDILDEDNYDSVMLDVSGDGSGDYEDVYGRKDLIETFERIKIARLEEEAEWDEDDEVEEDE